MAIFPLPSSNVQTTTVIPCAVTGKTVLVVPVMVPEQLSVAVGGVTETEHCACTSARTGTAGGVMSLMITFWFAVDMFPFPSSKVHVTTVVP
ncbi:hypothetical protein D3C87_985820 [compost metagenome]